MKKPFKAIFAWSSTPRKVLYQEDGWYIYESEVDAIYNGQSYTFITHGCDESESGWLYRPYCEKCAEPTPESISTLYTLYTWGTGQRIIC